MDFGIIIEAAVAVGTAAGSAIVVIRKITQRDRALFGTPNEEEDQTMGAQLRRELEPLTSAVANLQTTAGVQQVLLEDCYEQLERLAEEDDAASHHRARLSERLARAEDQ